MNTWKKKPKVLHILLFASASSAHYPVNKAPSTCTISLNSHSNPIRRILSSQLNREVNWSSDRWSDLPKVTQKISDRLRLKPRSSYFKSRDLSTHHSCIGRWDIVFLTSILEYKVNGDWAGKCGLSIVTNRKPIMALFHFINLTTLSALV